MLNDYIEALGQTLYMVLLSSFFSILIGFIISIILFLTCSGGLRKNKIVYNALDLIINTLRSIPFIILMIAVIPLTKFIVGTSIGTPAAVVPLTIGTCPFVARIMESALKEVDKGLIEAAQAFGCTTKQIILKVVIRESLPSIIMGITLTIINLIGCSAMAGAIGAKGLGDLAIRYGYHRFQPQVMIITILILIVLVQIIQFIGNILYKKFSNN